MIKTLILFIIISFLFYFINYKINLNIKENFYITQYPQQQTQPVTWTPYVIDVYNQPAYSNYFYQNGYMYPVY